MSDIDDLITAMESLQSTQELIKALNPKEEVPASSDEMSAALARLRSDNARVSKILSRLINDA